jgi:hypothetical protein
MIGRLLRLPFFRLLAVPFVLLILLTLAACGDSPATWAPAATTAKGAQAAAGTTAAATTAAAAATTAAATTLASGSSGTGMASGAAATPSQAKPLERKIIRNATLTIQVEDMETSLNSLRALATSLGGYLLQENTTSQGAKTSGVMVIQVPAEQYEVALTRIRQLAFKVDRQESSAQDVSDEFVDLQSQIANLKVTEEGLQKLIDKADKLEDIISLQKELTSVRGEIEQRQGRLNFLDNKTAFSTITVNLGLKPAPEAPTPTAAPAPTPAPVAEGWQPEKAIGQSWDASLKLLGGIITIIVQVIVFSWWYLPFLVAGLIILWRSKRMKAKDRDSSQGGFQ